ncbi:MAG: winged helix-turn-helix domain-containing protein [Candidatus Nitrosotenuis sp.]
MKEELILFIHKVKSNANLLSLGETAAKAGIIEPMLRILGWDTSIASNEVTLEYPVEDGRIDYCLQANKSSQVFLEAKKPAEDLDRHADQLLDYAFRQGVKLAILSSGITWSFYLPLTEGKWEHRRFYTIDILEQEASEAASRFVDFLSKENVLSGNAVKNAQSLLEGRRRQEIVESTIPEAWNRIVSEPDSILLELLSELTAKLCGFKPTDDDLKEFFAHNSGKLLLTPEDDIPESESTPTSTPTSTGDRESIYIAESDKISVLSLVPEIVRILQSHGGRARKEQVEEEVYHKFERSFRLPYYQQPVSTGVPRWQHNLAWAKEAAKNRGLVKRPSESGRGVWELTQSGRAMKV